MLRFALLPAALALAVPAAAQEVFAGALLHGVETPLTFETGEGGVDVQLGWRGAPLAALKAIGSPSPYVFGSVNTDGDTNFVAAGMAWTLNAGAIYVRPGLGIALHNGPRYRVLNGFQTQLGSRILFEPELGIGVRVSPRLSVEAQWTHISHAQIFGPQNPGLDMIGLRLNRRLK